MIDDSDKTTVELNVRAVEAAAKLVEHLPHVERPSAVDGRCHFCDRAKDVCQGSHECMRHRVDWRARCLEAERLLARSENLGHSYRKERDLALSQIRQLECVMSSRDAEIERLRDLVSGLRTALRATTECADAQLVDVASYLTEALDRLVKGGGS